MKRRRGLLWTLTVALALCGVCGMWLRVQREQYARNRALIDALTEGDAKTALAVVNAGADPNTHFALPPAPSLKLLLHQLLHHESSPAVNSVSAFMMVCGLDYDTRPDGEFNTILYRENLPLVQAMLRHGANVNARTADNGTALSCAVVMERWHTAELLLQHGTNINAQDEDGLTPLMLAVMDHEAEMARLLLSHGAKPDLQDMHGDTALSHAVIDAADANVVRELLAHGANPNIKNQKGYTPLALAERTQLAGLIPLLQHGGK